MSFYLKKNYVDNELGIELVNIHYTWTPMNTPPNWEAHRETRVMPRGGTLIRGMGGTTLDEHGQSVQTTTNKIELPDDGVWTLVAGLPPKQRTALALRFVADQQYAEISQVMDISQDAARRNVAEGLSPNCF